VVLQHAPMHHARVPACGGPGASERQSAPSAASTGFCMTSCVMGHTPTAGAVRALIAALAGEAKAARLPWLPGAGQRYMPAAAAVSVIANGGPVPNGAGSDAWAAQARFNLAATALYQQEQGRSALPQVPAAQHASCLASRAAGRVYKHLQLNSREAPAAPLWCRVGLARTNSVDTQRAPGSSRGQGAHCCWRRSDGRRALCRPPGIQSAVAAAADAA